MYSQSELVSSNPVTGGGAHFFCSQSSDNFFGKMASMENLNCKTFYVNRTSRPCVYYIYVPERDLEPDLEREGAGLRVADGLRLPEPDLEAAGDRDATELLDGDGDPETVLKVYNDEM